MGYGLDGEAIDRGGAFEGVAWGTWVWGIDG